MQLSNQWFALVYDLSFGDAAISGMVLQYKGFDGLWKCLLNRKYLYYESWNHFG